MIKNYFKIAWRNIKSDSFFAGLNIIGLGLGIAVSLLIIQYLRGEWSVDKHHTKYERIYRINTEFNLGGNAENYATVPSPMADKLLTDYPEVINATRLLAVPGVNQYLLKKDNLAFFESKGLYADSTFFEMFSYPFVEGSANSALRKPNDIVLSQTLAAKLFNNQPALGEAIVINTVYGDMTCQVSGVINTQMHRSHIDSELFVNMKTGVIGNRFAAIDEWAGNNMYYTYLTFNSNTDVSAFEKKFPALVEATAGERLRSLGFSKVHSLMPLQDIYLQSEVKANLGQKGSLTFFYILAVIGFFILVIACINFMNLSTAKSSTRATEVAVKKVLGATKSTLAFQFFTETILYIIMALVVAILFIALGQYFLQSQISLDMSNYVWLDWELGLWVIGVLTITAFLAGSYPALMLSSFSPASIFQGRLGNNLSAAQMRKGLVVIQFVISIMLIQGILVVKEQMKFIQSEDLGYSKAEKIVIPLSTDLASSKAQTLKQELLGLSAIENVGISSTHPGLPNIEDLLAFGEQKSREDNIHVSLNWGDVDLIPTMGFHLLKGRNFRETDSASAIVTLGALAGLGYTLDNALNKKLRWNWSGVEESRRIIGVIDDFHTESLRRPMQAQAFLLKNRNSQSFLIASLETSDLPQTISRVQQVWKSVNDVEPFEYYFLDDKVQHAYEADLNMSSLILVFTLLAILISCLGLIGLSAFAADRRKKEIGIRRVLGASITSIVELLSREFVWLVFISICIATPIAWYLTSDWLSSFAYSIEMPWGVYVWAGSIAVFICIVTVSYQSIRAAQANPIQSLKTE